MKVPTTATPPTPVVQPRTEIKKSDPIETQIRFEFGVSTPTKEGQKDLRRFVDLLATNHVIKTIELVGQTDDIGTQHFNSKLALKRASFVADWLRDNGVNIELSITTKEECCRQAPYDKTDALLEEKRRVSIVARE